MAQEKKSNSIYHQRTQFENGEEYIGNYFEDYSISPHIHAHYEYIYVKEGECAVKTPSFTILLKKGQALFLFPFCLHAIETKETSELYIISFSSGFVHEFERSVPHNPSSMNVYCPMQQINEIAFELLIKTRCTDKITLIGICNLICQDYLKKCNSVIKRKNNFILNQAITYINEHYKERINLSSVANAIGTNKNYLCRLFQIDYPSSFLEYLHHVRLFHAEILLKTTEMSISEIAEECGFSGERNMNTLFKKYYVNTPTAIRNLKKISVKRQ
ncbi:MAG: helix-turn-helix transcriptional regulator [Clostridia bacterium]|nr:helix-turn-helix transcriptional regulator [Clostridia bacterium]